MNRPDSDIARLIREVLAEELAKLDSGSPEPADIPSAGSIHERWVSVGTDADLNAFARDIIRMAGNRQDRCAFEKGQIVYRLKGSTNDPNVRHTDTPGREQSAGEVMTIESGFFPERQANRISGDVKRLRVGKAVRMTPLARDRLRQRGITIERMDT